MSDDIKPAAKNKGDTTGILETGVFERFNPGAVPADQDRAAPEAQSPLLTPAPDIEAEPGQDPQAPNRKGLG